ncbi:hypothetical protein L9F63_018366, partial [Diploptera punctata]
MENLQEQLQQNQALNSKFNNRQMPPWVPLNRFPNLVRQPTSQLIKAGTTTPAAMEWLNAFTVNLRQSPYDVLATSSTTRSAGYTERPQRGPGAPSAKLMTPCTVHFNR